jgi:hypothetical protein
MAYLYNHFTYLTYLVTYVTTQSTYPPTYLPTHVCLFIINSIIIIIIVTSSFFFCPINHDHKMSKVNFEHSFLSQGDT